jgi:hypothetical protein
MEEARSGTGSCVLALEWAGTGARVLLMIFEYIGGPGTIGS